MKKTLILGFFGLAAFSHAQTTLGAFTFVDTQFGDTLVESDGGTFSAGNWLNTTNADPGNPGYLTGVGFETGIANIDHPSPTYTIGYNTPIVNGIGDDFAIVVARFSSDNVEFSLSKSGVGFGGVNALAAGAFTDTGENRSYFYQNLGPYDADLFIATLDLTDYGFAMGESMDAINIGTGSGSDQLDLIRVAGLEPVPEPATMTLLSLGALAALRRKKRNA